MKFEDYIDHDALQNYDIRYSFNNISLIINLELTNSYLNGFDMMNHQKE